MAQDTKEAFLKQLEEVSPRLREAFEAVLMDIKGEVRFSELLQAIEEGNVEAAIAAVQIKEEFYDPFKRAIEQSFYQGGVYQLGTFNQRRLGVTVRMQGDLPEARAWVATRSSSLITEVVAEQKQAVREVVLEGITTGRNPRKVAYDIVGRTEGNERKGGILGLTSQQARFVFNMREELKDPSRMSNYFTRVRRDKRFDATVTKAMKEGKALPDSIIERISGRYADRLLQLRGETIGRTEALESLNAGRHEGVRQLLAKGEVPPEAIELIWDATPSDRTRDSHRSLNGQIVHYNEPFISPLTGAQFYFPGDRSLGAPASEIINCRCSFRIRIDYTKLVRK